MKIQNYLHRAKINYHNFFDWVVMGEIANCSSEETKILERDLKSKRTANQTTSLVVSHEATQLIGCSNISFHKLKEPPTILYFKSPRNK